jgi:diketogulonate reductase-like aldo/keto reductase
MPYRKRTVKQKKRSRKTRRRQRGGSQENNNLAEAIRLSLLNEQRPKEKEKEKAKPMAQMPQLCFGTAQGIRITELIKKALSLGYQHFDGANGYGGREYREAFKNGIAGVDRNSIWITWKSDSISYQEIKRVISDLNCEYIDLYLVHHSCGSPEDYAELQKAKDDNLVRFIGVSNCEDIKKVEQMKLKYNIYANQIQARPPGGKIEGRAAMDPEFIEKCNRLGVSVMMFGTVSGLVNAGNYIIFDPEKGPKVNKYYIQKFLKPSNALMVSSVNPGSSSLEMNKKDVDTFLSGTDLLTTAEMAEMEAEIKGTELAHM